jgi:hypothetical protein
MTSVQTATFGGQTYTYDSLFVLSGPEMCRLYNEAAPKAGMEKTKRFGDKVSGAKRTWAALTALTADEPSAQEAIIATAPSELAKADNAKLQQAANDSGAFKVVKPPKVKKEAAPRKPRGKRFVFPKGSELKPVREGTFRHTLVKLLTREHGATFEQCQAATWGTKADMEPEIQEKTTYEAMRLLHYYCGYGMRHLDDKASPHIQIYF